MKATNEELAEAVVKLSKVVAALMEMNVNVAKIAVPLAGHLSETEKLKLLSELDQMPRIARELQKTCERLGSQKQEATGDSSDEKPANELAEVNVQEISLGPEHAELETRAKAADRDAQFSLGELLEIKAGRIIENGDAPVHLIKAAAYWFRKAAEQGFAPAQFKLAHTYTWERIFPEKKNEVHYWYQKAGEQGYALAQFELGQNFKDGYWTDPSDEAKAEYWFKKAAEQGVLEAEYELASMLEEGRSSEAFEIYNRLAQKGESQAQIKLAEFYEKGEVVPKDDTEAFRWHLKAAQLGNSVACKEVGRRYLLAWGVEKNLEEAKNWLLKIAYPESTTDVGNMPEAQLYLSFVFADDENPQKDMVEAYKWLNLAVTYTIAENLRADIIGKRDEWTGSMTMEQVKEAQRRSSELFIPENKVIERLHGESLQVKV